MIVEEDLTSLLESTFRSAEEEIGRRVVNNGLMCQIYDCFAKPGDGKHNCLGCNLSDESEHLYTFLRVYNSTDVAISGHHVYSEYFMLLNTMWERISDVFNIVEYPAELKCKHFGAFIKARRWANFFKHPREYGWMAHHPRFSIEGTSEHDRLRQLDDGTVVVDDDFVKKYYASDSAKGLAKQFRGNESRVFVVFPNCQEITSHICDSLEKFVEVILKNEAYQELLADRTTIQEYYSKTLSSPNLVTT